MIFAGGSCIVAIPSHSFESCCKSEAVSKALRNRLIF
jgi:hypothetical protein